jgi:hypothetical protein
MLLDISMSFQLLLGKTPMQKSVRNWKEFYLSTPCCGSSNIYRRILTLVDADYGMGDGDDGLRA